MNYLIASGFLFVFLGCSSLKTSSNPSYEQTIQTYSDRKELYQGLENVFQIKGTLLNSEVQKAQVLKKSLAYEWSPEDIEKETRKVEENLKRETSIFVSFYSPIRKIDDLDKIHTVWKIFLDVHNKRYEGKAIKVTGVFDELLQLYPYHTRFGTPYRIVFNVPAVYIEDAPSVLTLTGALGAQTISFPALSK